MRASSVVPSRMFAVAKGRLLEVKNRSVWRPSSSLTTPTLRKWRRNTARSVCAFIICSFVCLFADTLFRFRVKTREIVFVLHCFSVCYHGTPLENAFSILQTGLRNMSGTRGMQSGAIFGDGIYLAESIDVAKQFTSFSTEIWSNRYST